MKLKTFSAEVRFWEFDQRAAAGFCKKLEAQNKQEQLLRRTFQKVGANRKRFAVYPNHWLFNAIEVKWCRLIVRCSGQSIGSSSALLVSGLSVALQRLCLWSDCKPVALRVLVGSPFARLTGSVTELRCFVRIVSPPTSSLMANFTDDRRQFFGNF